MSLWAITPEGRASNLGELQLNGDKGKLNVTTRLPNFAMIVTAEPYFAASAPSEMVVLQNVPSQHQRRHDTGYGHVAEPQYVQRSQARSRSPSIPRFHWRCMKLATRSASPK